MKNRTIIGVILLILLTTINPQKNEKISKFAIHEIVIENNLLIKEGDLKSALVPLYNQNLIFLDVKIIQKILSQESFIESFSIKKKFPKTLKIKIKEKKPVAILFNKKRKFYISEKIELIEFKEIEKFKNLPYVFGKKEEFKVFYNNLREINFPLDIIKQFTFYESNRWDIETIDKKIIKLPIKNYIKSLKNYLTLKDNKDFKIHKTFDYRINNQLILR